MTRPKAKKPSSRKTVPFVTEQQRAGIVPRKAPYWMKLKKGQALGFAKSRYGSVWVARQRGHGRQVIGVPPEEPPQKDYPVLDIEAAMIAAKAWCDRQVQPTKEDLAVLASLKEAWIPGSKERPEDPTVGHALDQRLFMLETKQIESKGTSRSKIRLIKRALGHIKLSALIANDIEVWLASIVTSPPLRRSKLGEDPNYDPDFDPENFIHKRRRQSTANRYRADLVAALNRAYENGWIDSDRAWRGVKPFPDAVGIRDLVLNLAQQSQLLNDSSPELKPMCYAALLTGNRPGPMRAWKVGNFRPLSRCILVGYDKGHKRERLAPLTNEAIAVFDYITDGRDPEEYMFLKADGKPWGRNHHSRPFAEGLEALNLDASFYTLRHTCITGWLMNGVDTAVVASAVGTSVQMIERHYKNPLMASVATLINAKATRIGPFDNEIDAVVAKYDRLRLEMTVAAKELNFSLAELHPSWYLGKVDGGRFDPPPPKPKPSREELLELVQVMPVSKIGENYEVSGVTAKKWLVEAGIPVPKRGDWAKHKRALRAKGLLPVEEAPADRLKPTKEELQDLVWKMPATAIGKLYGLSANAILKWAGRYEITCPGRGYWNKRAGEEHHRAKKARREAARQKKTSGQKG